MLCEPGPRPPLTPLYWLGWLKVSAIWLLGKAPQSLGLWLTIPLGALLRRTLGRRRRIAARNIERCFPSMGADQQERMLRGCFRSLARTVFETAWSWSASAGRIQRMGRVEGLAHVDAARRSGRGVLFVTAHLSCLEIGARLLAMSIPVAGIYRPLRDPVLEWYQNRSRLAYGKAVIGKRDMRGTIKWLRRGGMIWYAPDQDFGPDRSVFAPFFGIQTATLVATRRLAQLTGCAVMPMFPAYDVRQRKYIVRIQPALDRFPGADAVGDLTRINALMEEHIRLVPEQYWWVHRRFKTRPYGESAFYD